MQIRKRCGTLEPVKFEKISKRLKDASKNLEVDHVLIAQKVIEGLYDGISSPELDLLASEIAYSNSTKHFDYDKLATRLIISRLHKDTPSTFSECVNILHNATDSFGNNKSILATDFVKFVNKHAHVLDAAINYNRDFDYDYFGYKTLERSYLLKTFVKNPEGKLVSKIVERPQHMLLRVAVAIHLGSISDVLNTYELLSTKQFTHATPTLFNSGLVKNQLSSCFAAGTKVFTFNKGNVNIEDVEIGDLVLTHKNNIKPVVQLHKNELADRQMYALKAFGSPQVKVTDNHKFYSITSEQLNWGESPQWNSVDKLRVGDYISIGNLNNNYESYSDSYLIKYLPKNNHLVSNEPSFIKNINDQTFVRINEKNKINFEDKYVYTLGVKDDHSYLVEGLMAENCFLLTTKNDSIIGIYDTLKEIALISQSSGGIGVSVSNVRSNGSPIFGSGGISNGIIPMLKVFNETARYVDQCLVQDQKICTNHGLIKISNIEIGDKVKNFNGTYSEVTSKKDFECNDELISIKLNNEILTLTKNHPILVVRCCSSLSEHEIKTKLTHKLLKPEWVCAENILETDVILGLK